jgi:hypothetical protein
MQVNNPGVVVDVDKNIMRSYVVDVEQPRHRGMDFNNVGKYVKSSIFKDDKEKLLTQIDMQRPVVIGGRKIWAA